MRKCLAALLLLVMAGCGGSGAGSQSSAQISGLTIAAPASSSDTSRNTGSGSGDGAFYVNPSSRNSGGGLSSSTNWAILDFLAPDGNVAAFVLVVRDANGQLVFSQQGPIAGITGMTTGQIDIVFPTNVSLAAGNYSCQVTVTDTTGRVSNTLVANFTVS
jgi:hypothetical protein